VPPLVVPLEVEVEPLWRVVEPLPEVVVLPL
jgi:hypothetical protein